MYNIEHLAKLSTMTHGVFTREILRKNNFTESQIKSLITKGILRKEEFGVYTLLGSNPTWHQKANVAIFSCGDKARLSHLSVLQLFNLVEVNDRNRTIHVLNPRKDFRNSNAYFHRSLHIDEYDLNNQSFGIKHVSLERALIDSTSALTDRQLSYIFDSMLTKKLVNIDLLNYLLKELKRAPGRCPQKLVKLISSTTTNFGSTSVESILEKRVEDVLNKVTHNKIVRQFEVQTESHLYRLDFAIPELKIAIEVEGFGFHKDRATFDYDQIRNTELAILGWTVLHITATMKDYEIKNLLRRALAA